jgi:hypothetical protein
MPSRWSFFSRGTYAMSTIISSMATREFGYQNLSPLGADHALNLSERLLASCFVAGLVCVARPSHGFSDNLRLLWRDFAKS